LIAKLTTAVSATQIQIVSTSAGSLRPAGR
jgi:hypothetical protein